MTFIRAEKLDNEIIIVSDTKLTYAPSSDYYNSQDTLGTGTIKSVILSDNICMSFSGDISYFTEALINIGNNRDLLYIIDILHNVNKKACSNEHDNEFILAFLDGDSFIIEFKDSDYEEVISSWIGSIDGFSAYQKSFYSTPQTPLNVNLNDAMTKETGGYSINQDKLMELFCAELQTSQLELMQDPNLSIQFGFSIQKLPDGYSAPQMSHFSKMVESVINVIEDNSIPEVGGFHVIVATQNNSFQYMPRAARLNTPINYNELTHVIDYMESSNENQHVNFFTHSNDALALHISTSNVGIFFSKDRNSFMQPTILYPYDEIDFSYELYVRYGIDSSFGIESNYRVLQDKAQQCYRTDPQKAIYFMLNGIKKLEKEIRNELGNSSSHEPLEYYCLNEYSRKAYLSQYYENIGITYYTAKDMINAKHYIESALSVNPQNHGAQRVYGIINNEIQE